MARQKDLLSYLIIERYGGIFLDMDSICLESFDSLRDRYSYYIGLGPYIDPLFKTPQANVGNFGASKGHPIIKGMVDGFLTYFWDREF